MVVQAQIGGGDDWRLYDYVARHFLASLSADALIRKTKVVLTAAGEIFTASGKRHAGSGAIDLLLQHPESNVLVVPETGAKTENPGYTTVMPWKSSEGCQLPALEEGEVLTFQVLTL